MKWICLLFFLCCMCQVNAQNTYKSLRNSWDTVTVFSNPHKGWYIHYYDNGIDKYGASLASNDFLEDLKGLNHVYLRLAWSYLEPEEGVYNWQLIDSIIEKWTGKGYKITFRITCKETNSSQVFATPEWVKIAGAKGTFVGKYNNWEPDFGDSVFLNKLENFHRVFGARYSAREYVEYVDIGSLGDWGEGHTVFGSRKEYPFEVIKKHIDIYKRHYPGVLLMISDDFITSRTDPNDPETSKILRYILEQGIAFRDDSVSVKYFAEKYGFSTLRSQYLFEKTWRTLPGDLELEHYQVTLDYNTWKKGKPLEAAIHEAHATYVGFHGPPRQWMKDNPGYVDQITNKIGYWYFIDGVSYPDVLKAGSKFSLDVSWFNKGVAPAYKKYSIYVSVNCGGKEFLVKVSESDNRRWMPDLFTTENYQITLPEDFPNGIAAIGIKMIAETSDSNKDVGIGLKWKNSSGFYIIGRMKIINNKSSGKKKLVLFGDSITEGAFSPSGYGTLLNQNHYVGSKYELIGAGIGGNRVTDLARRLEKDVLSYNPHAVLLFVGVNDCGWHEWHPEDSQVSVYKYEELLNNLVLNLKQRSINVIICTPAIIGENISKRTASDYRLDFYADACRRVAKKNKCELIDLRRIFINYLKTNNHQKDEHGVLTTDGVHFNQKGNSILAKALEKVL